MPTLQSKQFNYDIQTCYSNTVTPLQRAKRENALYCFILKSARIEDIDYIRWI